jgi:hypothetical protein
LVEELFGCAPTRAGAQFGGVCAVLHGRRRVVRQKTSEARVGATLTIIKRSPGVRLCIDGVDHSWAFCDEIRRAKGRCGA